MSRKMKIVLAALLIACVASGCANSPSADGNGQIATPPASSPENPPQESPAESQQNEAYTLDEEGIADLKATGIITYSFGEERPEDWANNIKEVYLRKSSDIKEGQPVTDADLIADGKHTVSTVKMLLDSDMFPIAREQSEIYEVTIRSEGSDDYHVGLTVHNRTPDSFTIREIDKAGAVLKEKTFSYDDMAEMCSTEFYISTGCVMHGFANHKAEGLALTDLFEKAGIRFEPGMAMAVRATDSPTSIEATETNNPTKTGVIFDNPEKYWIKPRYTDNFKHTYENLIERKRYFITAPWEDAEIGARLKEDTNKFSFEARELLASKPEYMTEIPPIIALKYTSADYNSDPSDIRTIKNNYHDLTANERAFRFLYGLAIDNDPVVNVTAYDSEKLEYPVVTTPENAGKIAVEEGDDACGLSARMAMLVFGIDVFVDGE